MSPRSIFAEEKVWPTVSERAREREIEGGRRGEAGVIICTGIDGDGRQYCDTPAVNFVGLAAFASGEKRGPREGTAGFKVKDRGGGCGVGGAGAIGVSAPVSRRRGRQLEVGDDSD
jgi:hypothetical protein